MPTKKKAATRELKAKDAAKFFDAYARRKNPILEPLVYALRRLVKKTVPASREMVNPWGIPSFEFFGPFCFLMVGKHHVTFGFARGTSLHDPAGLLEGTGKNLRHVKLTETAQLRDANFRRLIQQAASLNRATPLTSSMRAKKPA